jgi:hypothetical protein
MFEGKREAVTAIEAAVLSLMPKATFKTLLGHALAARKAANDNSKQEEPANHQRDSGA